MRGHAVGESEVPETATETTSTIWRRRRRQRRGEMPSRRVSVAEEGTSEAVEGSGQVAKRRRRSAASPRHPCSRGDAAAPADAVLLLVDRAGERQVVGDVGGAGGGGFVVAGVEKVHRLSGRGRGDGRQRRRRRG